MYAVSDEYKKAMKERVQRFRISGTVGGKEFNDHDNILSGSFSITNQCSDDAEVKIGQVYVGELDVTLRNIDLPRYTIRKMQIIPSFGLQLADQSYEDIPLGIFNIQEASWTASGIAIKAYDNMIKLDRNFSVSVSNGEIYDFMTLACNECGVPFGMTQAECEALPNGRDTFSLWKDNDIETWRDFVSWVAQTCACFATVDRQGRIILKQYNQDPVDTIDSMNRFTGCSFSDFETRYTGISCVNIEDQTTSYYALDQDDGLTYNLGQNPLLQYGVEATKKRQRMNILNGMSGIDYVPFEVSMIGNPAYDLGDVLVFSDGIADGSKKYCITKYTFAFHGEYKAVGVGKNPVLYSAKSKSDKDIAGLLSRSTEDHSTFYIYSFKSAKEFEFSENETEVASINFGTVDATMLDMVFMSNHELTLDGECIVRIYLDGDLFNTYTDYEARGKHILTLNWSFAARANARYTATITMQWHLFISDRRIDAADRRTLWNYADSIVWAMARQNGTWSALQIFAWDHLASYAWNDLSGDEIGQNTWNDVLNGSNAISPNDIAYHTESPDESIGHIKIETGQINAVIFGRGLVATDTWDGTIRVSDRIPEHVFNVVPDAFMDAGGGKLITDKGGNVNDTVNEAGVMSITPEPFTDALLMRDGMRWSPADVDHYTMTGDTVVDGDHWSGAGTVTTDNLPVSKVIRAHGQSSGDTVVYAFSFDGGTTFNAYINGEWTKDGTNTEAQIQDIPETAWSGIDQIMIRATLIEKSVLYEMNVYFEEYEK